MVGKYKVITLCGSTRFKDAFFEAQKRLTLEGNIVISVGLFGHSGDNEVWTEGTKEVLDDMGRVDAAKLNAFAFDQMRNGYYAMGEKLGQAWNIGAGYLKK